jgi:hypothetical protein
MFEQLTRLPVRGVRPESATDPVPDDRTLMLVITQSGETVYTLPMDEGRESAHLARSLTTAGAAAGRQRDLYAHRPEIGVGSTKALLRRWSISTCWRCTCRLRGTAAGTLGASWTTYGAANVGRSTLDPPDSRHEIAQTFFTAPTSTWAGHFPIALGLEAKGDHFTREPWYEHGPSPSSMKRCPWWWWLRRVVSMIR